MHLDYLNPGSFGWSRISFPPERGVLVEIQGNSRGKNRLTNILPHRIVTDDGVFAGTARLDRSCELCLASRFPSVEGVPSALVPEDVVKC